MRNQTEILVIGAGPAGATLARCLAEAGQDVTLIDKAALPRHKPCGGGLPQRTLDLLPATCRPEHAGSVKSVRLAGAWRGNLDFALPADTECLVVERSHFDQQLAMQAKHAGATLVQNCRLIAITRHDRECLAKTSRGEIRARVVAACDGVFSPAGRALGFAANALGFCLEATVRMPDDLPQPERTRATFHLGCLADGYAWSFPRNHEFAVGVGSARSKAPDLQGRLRDLPRIIPGLKQGATGRVWGGMLPDFRQPRGVYAQENAYLVGDAAGLVDPLTGEGIFYAIRSAQLAARAITGAGTSEYQELLARELLPELRISLKLARRFRRTPAWMRGLLMSLPGFRSRMQDFVDILCGRARYTERFS